MINGFWSLWKIYELSCHYASIFSRYIISRSVGWSVCPSVGPSVRPLVRPSVRPSVRRSRVFFKSRKLANLTNLNLQIWQIWQNLTNLSQQFNLSPFLWTHLCSNELVSQRIPMDDLVWHDIKVHLEAVVNQSEKSGMSQIQRPPYSSIPLKGRNFQTKKDRISRLVLFCSPWNFLFNGHTVFIIWIFPDKVIANQSEKVGISLIQQQPPKSERSCVLHRKKTKSRFFSFKE